MIALLVVLVLAVLTCLAVNSWLPVGLASLCVFLLGDGRHSPMYWTLLTITLAMFAVVMVKEHRTDRADQTDHGKRRRHDAQNFIDLTSLVTGFFAFLWLVLS